MVDPPGVVADAETVVEHGSAEPERSAVVAGVERLREACGRRPRQHRARRLADRFVFIDADKENNANYLAWALRLARPGTTIVVDNVVRDGRILNAASRDRDVVGVRRMFEAMKAEPRLAATAVQTVGAKGWDGFALAVVMPA